MLVPPTKRQTGSYQIGIIFLYTKMVLYCEQARADLASGMAGVELSSIFSGMTWIGLVT
jgi:hypothetical protein